MSDDLKPPAIQVKNPEPLSDTELVAYAQCNSGTEDLENGTI